MHFKLLFVYRKKKTFVLNKTKSFFFHSLKSYNFGFPLFITRETWVSVVTYLCEENKLVTNVGARSEIETFLLQHIIEFEMNEDQHKQRVKLLSFLDFMGGTVALWLVCSTPEQTVWVPALTGDNYCFFKTRHLMLNIKKKYMHETYALLRLCLFKISVR